MRFSTLIDVVNAVNHVAKVHTLRDGLKGVPVDSGPRATYQSMVVVDSSVVVILQ